MRIVRILTRSASSLLKNGDWLRDARQIPAKTNRGEVPVPLFQQAASEGVRRPARQVSRVVWPGLDQREAPVLIQKEVSRGLPGYARIIGDEANRPIRVIRGETSVLSVLVAAVNRAVNSAVQSFHGVKNRTDCPRKTRNMRKRRTTT